MGTEGLWWRAHLAALRPRQVTKNVIVYAAPLFSFSLGWGTLLQALLAFRLFCATLSSFYLLNDMLDVESDQPASAQAD